MSSGMDGDGDLASRSPHTIDVGMERSPLTPPDQIASEKARFPGLDVNLFGVPTEPGEDSEFPRWWSTHSEVSLTPSVIPQPPLPPSSDLKYSIVTHHFPEGYHHVTQWKEAPWRIRMTISLSCVEHVFPGSIPWREHIASHCYEDTISQRSTTTNAYRRTIGIAFERKAGEVDWDVSITIYSNNSELVRMPRWRLVQRDFIGPRTAVWASGRIWGERDISDSPGFPNSPVFYFRSLDATNFDGDRYKSMCFKKRVSFVDEPNLRDVVDDHLYRHLHD